jgi:hypothetical protein
VILLDDLENYKEVSEILTTLKQVLSMDSIKKAKILIGITTTPDTWLRFTQNERHHPLSRYFLSRINLQPLSELEMNETIMKSLSGTGISFDKEIITKVYKSTNGHPFEMQVLCFHLFENKISRIVDIDVWQKAFEGALNELGNAMFEYLFSQASDEESKVIRILASFDKPIMIKAIVEEAKLNNFNVPNKNIGKYLQRLVDKKLITKINRGSYIVNDPMFRAYINYKFQ